MKRLPLLLVLGALVAAPFAHADEHTFFSEDGIVMLPNPTSKAVGGVTESFNPCGTDDPDLGDLNGVDGHWIELPEGAVGRAATLTSDAVDMDVWFYTGFGTGCALINDDADPSAYNMATDLTANEAGTIPAGATFAIVDLAVGANAAFTFEIA